MKTHNSEVARMREQIDLEHEAAHRAISAPALGTARHDFINARMARAAERIFHLIQEEKHEEAQALMESSNWGEEEGETGHTTTS
jgi:hypothetical protein